MESALNPDPLAWLSDILWPDGAAAIVPVDDTPDGRPATTWWASPNATQPNILVPVDDAAAAVAVRRYHDGFSTARRLKSLAAEVTMSVPGMAERVLGGRQVGVVEFHRDGDGGVLGGIRDLLGVADLRIAVSLALPKSNRKPVLQLLDPAGNQHGWAKVAWNSWTEALVGNEARWLVPRPRAPLVSPELLHDTEIVGRRVVITTGFTAARLPRRDATALPPPAVLLAVAALGDERTATIGGSSWARSVEAVLSVASMAERQAIEDVLSGAESCRLRLGAWHGDLTPWNLMTARSGSSAAYQLIDWEFAADDVPLGFDLCHFHTQVGAEMKGLDADRALDYSARLSPQGLSDLGVAPENQVWVFRLYLVELMRRTLALRAAGRETGGVAQGAAALRRLSRRGQGLTAERPPVGVS